MNFAILGFPSLSSSYALLLALCLCGDLPTCSCLCWRHLLGVYSCVLCLVEDITLEESFCIVLSFEEALLVFLSIEVDLELLCKILIL